MEYHALANQVGVKPQDPADENLGHEGKDELEKSSDVQKLVRFQSKDVEEEYANDSFEHDEL